MDNKQDRKFFWSVQDFVKNPTVNHPTQPTKSKVTDAVKAVMENNKPFKQSNFVPNSNTINIASQAISSIEINRSGYRSQSPAFSSNDTSNPFGMQQLDEGPRLARIGRGVVNFLKNPDQYLRGGASALRTGSVSGAAAVKQWAKDNPITAYTLGGGAALTAAALGVSAMMGGTGDAEPDVEEGDISPKPDWAKAGAATTGSEAEKPKTLEDKLDAYTDAFGMPVPTFRERHGSKYPGNYREWRTAVDARNAALRAANKDLRREREGVRTELGKIADAKAALRAGGAEKPPEGTEERKRYDDLVAQQGELMRKGRKISDLTSNDGLANTLRQQSADRQSRWATKLGEFKTKMKGVDFDESNPEHQNVMRGIMGFGSLTRKPVSTGPEAGEMDPITGGSDWDGRYLTQGQRDRLAAQTPAKNTTSPARSNIGQVDFTPDTPDWVRRHAAKFGEESARELEAMRLGVTSVLQGDPTRPMDTSMSAAEVARRGQLLARDRKAYAEQNPMTTSGRGTGVGTGKTASQPESTWDEVARRSVRGDSELANAPLVRRGGRVFAQTANGEIELSTGSMMTSQYADNAPTREQMNRGRR